MPVGTGKLPAPSRFVYSIMVPMDFASASKGLAFSGIGVWDGTLLCVYIFIHPGGGAKRERGRVNSLVSSTSKQCRTQNMRTDASDFGVHPFSDVVIIMETTSFLMVLLLLVFVFVLFVIMIRVLLVSYPVLGRWYCMTLGTIDQGIRNGSLQSTPTSQTSNDMSLSRSNG